MEMRVRLIISNNIYFMPAQEVHVRDVSYLGWARGPHSGFALHGYLNVVFFLKKCEGSGKTVPLCRLVRAFPSHQCIKFCSFVLFDLILYIPSTIFQFNRDGSSWVEPLLS